ncbi:MAG TPA: hypothetical protein VKG45_00715 [Actinomycetes bacterium]|nr:hypothetical protein [Actinomycetes bacterium]
MRRGHVLPDDAAAWRTGLISSNEYFARARQRATQVAVRAVRVSLRAAVALFASPRSGRFL